MAQQLVAKIKKSSKYTYQAPPEGWFAVSVVNDSLMPLRGNNNNYSFRDVAMGVIVGDHVIEFDGGKKIRTDVYGLHSLADA